MRMASLRHIRTLVISAGKGWFWLLPAIRSVVHHGSLGAAIAFYTWNPQSRRFAASRVREQPYSIQTMCPFIVSKPLGLRRANMHPRKTVR